MSVFTYERADSTPVGPTLAHRAAAVLAMLGASAMFVWLVVWPVVEMFR